MKATSLVTSHTAFLFQLEDAVAKINAKNDAEKRAMQPVAPLKKFTLSSAPVWFEPRLDAKKAITALVAASIVFGVASMTKNNSAPQASKTDSVRSEVYSVKDKAGVEQIRYRVAP